MSYNGRISSDSIQVVFGKRISKNEDQDFSRTNCGSIRTSQIIRDNSLNDKYLIAMDQVENTEYSNKL